MQQFIAKYGDQIQGVLTGFDRLIFRGCLRGLNYGYWEGKLGATVAQGMEQYLCRNGILFKDYSRHVKRISQQLKQASELGFKQQGLPVLFLRSARVDKEGLARRIAVENQIEVGPVCVLSALEPSPTFEHRGTHIIRRERPCHVLYQYWIHPEVGWMHARIQSWFPFNIQIGLNGREWLAQQMQREKLKYRQQGNCFVWIEDYTRAQQLMELQLKTDWAGWLNQQAKVLNPLHERIFEHYPTRYYWICYQSEWATDLRFPQAQALERLMPGLVRHGMLSFSSGDVMRYFGKKLTAQGDIPTRFRGTLQTDLKQYHEGERVKYRLNGNSVKFYDKAYSPYGSVLRGAETTLNTVTDFRVYRPKEGGPEEELDWRPLRKGIADLYRRAEVSQRANERLLDALASVDDSRSVEELTCRVQQPVIQAGRRVRGLRPWAEDHALLAAINHGEFLLHGFRNRDLQKLLYHQEPQSVVERRRRSAATSRKLRMLRLHGLIYRVQHTHRYQITAAGRAVLVAVLTTARTTLQQLNQLATAA